MKHPWLLAARRVAPLFLLAGILVLLGCSEPTASGGVATVWGTVTTGDGVPVEGAAILVGYRPSFADLMRPRESPSLRSLTIDPGSILWLGITDACGDTIRLLCAAPCSSEVFWDGRDDQGKRVLDGIYRYWMEIKGDSLAENKTITKTILLLSEYPDWDSDDYRDPHATTGVDGSFSFTDQCLGFGEIVLVSGDEEREYPVTRWIDLLAIHPDGRRLWADSVFVPPEGSVEIDLVIPGESTASPLIIGQETEIPFGGIVGDPARNVFLSFRDVNDSRCPTGAVCVWEGDARVSLVFQEKNYRADLELHTFRGYPQTVQVHGYEIRLIEVRPYPDAMNPATKEDYVIVVEVTEI